MAKGRIDFGKLRAAAHQRCGCEQAGAVHVLVAGRADTASVFSARNLFIGGYNLEVLKLLYKVYAGEVKFNQLRSVFPAEIVSSSGPQAGGIRIRSVIKYRQW